MFFYKCSIKQSCKISNSIWILVKNFWTALGQEGTNECSYDVLKQSVFDGFDGTTTVFERKGNVLYLVDNFLFQSVNIPKFMDCNIT
jgi:hypothetical protein